MSKIINAVFGGGLFATTAKVFQYDVGDKLRFLGVDLPDGYSVDFANSLTGASTTVYGDADGVEIPPEYFIPGTAIYAWVVISDADGHYTKYQAKIPIYERAARSSVEPTPAQADALDEAINALNSAVEDVQDIADNLNEQINTALEEAKESGEFDGPQGPEGPQGPQGPTGPTGAAGEDGNCIWWTTDAVAIGGTNVYYTQERNVQGRAGAMPQAKDLLVGPDPGTAGPVAYLYSVRGIYNTYVYLDGIGSIKGDRGQQGLQGPAGADGFSPTVTVTEITGGHRVTITDAEGDHVYDVMDGAQGETGTAGADGSGVWISTYHVTQQQSGSYGILRRHMQGREGAVPQAGDLVYAPELDEGDGEPTALYQITTVNALVCYATRIGSIKGDTGATGPVGPQGPAYTLTAADKEEIVDDVLAALPTWTGGNY